MKSILRHGFVRKYIALCPKCACEFTYHRPDVYTCLLHRAVDCPCCGASVSHDGDDTGSLSGDAAAAGAG